MRRISITSAPLVAFVTFWMPIAFLTTIGGPAASAEEPDVSAPTTRQAVPQESGPAEPKTGAFIHPGLLSNEEDFRRMRAMVDAGREPWKSDWEKLIANRHSSLKWNPRPQEAIFRGAGHKGEPQNYPLLYNDVAAAYAVALRWKITGDSAYAQKGIEILDAWANTLSRIGGTNDKFLAAGIYGYEIANAGEILRTYPGWPPDHFERFKKMMLDVFYPMNHEFLAHNGGHVDHSWANWDLCNMASMEAIGVLADRRDIYNEAIEYFKHGAGNGSIEHVVWKLYPDGLGQWQESGRDQAHTTLGIGLLGAFCQVAWNQGDDLFGYDDNRFLKGAEYVAKYNLGQDVPYTPYANSDVRQDVISDLGRGGLRPIWELVYNHYVVLKGLPAPFVQHCAEKVRPEGGGGDYGPNSGGFDQLGYGTLVYKLKGP
jgi:hypothetical protein